MAHGLRVLESKASHRQAQLTNGSINMFFHRKDHTAGMRSSSSPPSPFVHCVSKESSRARQAWGLSADVQSRTMPLAAHRPHPSPAGLTTEAGQGRGRSTLVPTPLGLRRL